MLVVLAIAKREDSVVYRLANVQTALPGVYEDGDGLRLLVSPKGNKRWELRYSLRGKRHDMSLGPYPEISLAEVRNTAVGLRAGASQPTNWRRSSRPKA